MSSRDWILQRVRANQPEARPLPTIPAFERTPAAASFEAFVQALERMGGKVVTPAPGQPADDLVRTLFPQARLIVSATLEVCGTRRIEVAIGEPAQLEDVDVGVVRAAFGIAETGSVFVSEREFVVNAVGFLPQHLVVLLDPATLLPDLHHAYRQRAFFEARYAALMTGPSATADIEGVLIRGAQGIRSLTVVACAAP